MVRFTVAEELSIVKTNRIDGSVNNKLVTNACHLILISFNPNITYSTAYVVMFSSMERLFTVKVACQKHFKLTRLDN